MAGGSFLTPHFRKNLLAASPKSINEKNSPKLNQKEKALIWDVF